MDAALADVGSSIEDAPHWPGTPTCFERRTLPEKCSRFPNTSTAPQIKEHQPLAGINEEAWTTVNESWSLTSPGESRLSFRPLPTAEASTNYPRAVTDSRSCNEESAKQRTEGDEGESHYKALRELVGHPARCWENRRLIASRALLDPRYRLQFFVIEVDRQTGSQSPPRTGSCALRAKRNSWQVTFSRRR